MPRRTSHLLRWLGVALVAALVLTALPVLLLRVWHPYTSAFMLQVRLQSADARAPPPRIRYEWVDYAHIAPSAALAVMASEDQQFPFHHGFDVNSIRAAERNNEEGGRLRGASTISQQLAKNLFLWPGRSYLRKALEAWFTLLLETLLPKQRILETYLNIVQFGPGIFGVEAAAREFFHSSAEGLTPSEAALLAAVLPNPERLHVERPSRYVEERRDWILGQMHTLAGAGYLSLIARGSQRTQQPPEPPRHSRR
ncbi:MAG TPA: monofunctional biosynthetic peptidoglycan transglycosylase [Steroidobacteraceae bacterium]|jgi:monofunctional biosynthetic peptidoglycan transglycosylase|nr:monofunctional biosynthetic peptidoglycan transglycosylase [Steroidobacteraceae bacterium]